ncbi:MAG TPA: helix-turn-helix transcriptional regulator [Spongiibacteraceae bacterium]|jgi:DNA-binding CsgD family transcriptional regulator|nr:helix-turn-helix transcriptional regulator [Spongiibacteraceae bacterium]HUH38965.1 helix-turn-helix transcriptional regulator [Spongiibacteraceae bacterium]
MASDELQHFNQLVVALYNGPREASPWQGFLQLLCERLQARLSVITLSRPRPNDPGLTFTGGMQFDSASQLQYANDYAALDPFVNLPDGVAVTLEEMVPLAQLQKTAYYREHLAPVDIVQILGMDIYRGERVGIGLRVARGRGAPAFGAQERALFNLLGPHLRQLLEWLDRDKRYQAERSLYEGITSRLEMGVILLDQQRRIVHCNPVASHLLTRAEGIREHNGRLVAVQAGDNRQLQAALEACCGGRDVTPALAEALTLSGDGASPLYLLVKPLRATEPDEEPRAAVYVRVPELLSPAQQGILQQLFDFTPSEARLAIALANGLSLDEIAEELFVTRNTLRSQLRSAFQKTGVNQQSALVSLVLRSVAGLG